VDVRIVGEVSEVEAIARGPRIRELERLRRIYGPGRWRKLKGIARVRLPDGTVSWAEVHWYEAHGVGRKEFKVKRLLGERT
jgi:hypothetical protein